MSRYVRSALDLLDLSVIQMDIPASTDALEEVSEKVNLVITSLALDDDMKGFEFALRIKQKSNETAVMIVGDENDPDELDEETAAESPFVYMSRPLDVQLFLRALTAGLNSHEAMIKAMRTPVVSGGNTPETGRQLGPVPSLDLTAAKPILEGLQGELGAMAIILADREGTSLLEVGTTGFIERDDLTLSLAPVMQTNMGIKEHVGGQVTTVQFYDGDEFDVFVLSVGLHHFISLIFEGQMGARQQGFVNRFGRKAVEDLIGLIGAEAFFVIPAVAQEEQLPKRTMTTRAVSKDEPVELARAEISFDEEEEAEELEPVIEEMEPIDNLDLDQLFGDDDSVESDLFDFDKVEQIAKESETENRKGRITWDDAKDLGVLKD